MPFNFAADSFHTKKLCSILSSSEVQFFYGHRPFCVFETPFGDLGATYDDHLRLIGKRIVDFLLALIELFSLGVTAEALRAITVLSQFMRVTETDGRTDRILIARPRLHSMQRRKRMKRAKQKNDEQLS